MSELHLTQRDSLWKPYHSSLLHFTAHCCSQGLRCWWGKEELRFCMSAPQTGLSPAHKPSCTCCLSWPGERQKHHGEGVQGAALAWSELARHSQAVRRHVAAFVSYCAPQKAGQLSPGVGSGLLGRGLSQSEGQKRTVAW